MWPCAPAYVGGEKSRKAAIKDVLMGGCQSRRDVTGLWRCHGEWFIDVYQEWIDQRAAQWQAINQPSNQRWELSIRLFLDPSCVGYKIIFWGFPRDDKNRNNSLISWLFVIKCFRTKSPKTTKTSIKESHDSQLTPKPFFPSASL